MKKKIFLLINFLLCTSLYSQVLTNSIIRGLRVKPAENQQLYTGRDLKFELFIPYISSSLVDSTDPENTDTMNFVSMHRFSTQGDEENPSGTKIELTLNFSKKGSYKPAPLIVRIRNIPYQIQFESFSVALNPQEQTPLVVVEFENGERFYSDSEKNLKPVFEGVVGEKINFRIYLQFGIQLIQFAWDLPKDAIFKQLKTYEITEPKYREKVFTEELIPIADFEWIPLVPGIVDFPDFKFTAIAFNGNKYDLHTQAIKGTVLQAPEITEVEKNDYLASAFDFTAYEEEKKLTVVVSEQQCYELARLRCEEKKAITSKIKNQRIEMEESLGLPVADSEFPEIIFYLSLIFTLIFGVFLCIFIKKNSLRFNIFIVILTLGSMMILFYSIRRINEDYAVTKGGSLCSIPEVSAEKKTNISAGNRVKIVEKTGSWFYIQIGEIGGWCKDDNLILID